ncbi:DUF1624 domain-containing protein [Dyadobacter soli]|nr:heparan-alpha-glucosaminide N-acetyltransferase domain-containing protein [Dyadobacter soli]
MYNMPIPDYPGSYPRLRTSKRSRVESIDLLRGVVMILMALDHVRDYFHKDAFLFSPTDLTQTNAAIFLTRLITHFCAPVFIFLAGTSAYLYGSTRGKKQLSFYLFTRGLWLIFAECFIVTLEWTFNPSYPYFNLAVIWVTGLSMVLLSALIYADQLVIAVLAVLIIAGHNLLDGVHYPGTGSGSFMWALLHEPGSFTFGHSSFTVRYPLLPWVGIMALGYTFGRYYLPTYNAQKRKQKLRWLGVGAVILFAALRASNGYGDPAHWAVQTNGLFSALSFLNVSKYPPSLLYVLMTLGPAFIFLSLFEKTPGIWRSAIAVFGRVPMFYYLAHLLLIHSLAIVAAVLSGYQWQDMVLNTNVNKAVEMQGYGFSLVTVYLVWLALIFILYTFCKRFDKYKRTNHTQKWWLGYL